jgi:hypothetical protein
MNYFAVRDNGGRHGAGGESRAEAYGNVSPVFDFGLDNFAYL